MGTPARSVQEIDIATLRWHAAADHSASAAARRRRPRQFDGYGLDLGVVLQGGLAVLPAVTGHLEAPEGRRGIDDVVAVHPDGARLDGPGERVGLVDVLRPNGCRQPVVGP